MPRAGQVWRARHIGKRGLNGLHLSINWLHLFYVLRSKFVSLHLQHVALSLLQKIKPINFNLGIHSLNSSSLCHNFATPVRFYCEKVVCCSSNSFFLPNHIGVYLDRGNPILFKSRSHLVVVEFRNNCREVLLALFTVLNANHLPSERFCSRCVCISECVEVRGSLFSYYHL